MRYVQRTSPDPKESWKMYIRKYVQEMQEILRTTSDPYTIKKGAIMLYEKLRCIFEKYDVVYSEDECILVESLRHYSASTTFWQVLGLEEIVAVNKLSLEDNCALAMKYRTLASVMKRDGSDLHERAKELGCTINYPKPGPTDALAVRVYQNLAHDYVQNRYFEHYASMMLHICHQDHIEEIDEERYVARAEVYNLPLPRRRTPRSFSYEMDLALLLPIA